MGFREARCLSWFDTAFHAQPLSKEIKGRRFRDSVSCKCWRERICHSRKRFYGGMNYHLDDSTKCLR